MRKVRLGISLIKILLKFMYYRCKYDQLYILISTPCYGNVGDHTIELAQQEILEQCRLLKYSIDISSIEYSYLKGVLKRFIYVNDIIIIDGGGNFGDTWPETMQNINEIVLTYLNNRIFVFPESWYFSETNEGKDLLNESIQILNSHNNLIIYARDGWSYKEMKVHLNNVVVRYSFDVVLFKQYSPCCVVNDTIKVGISVRDDKESVNEILLNRIRNDLGELDVDVIDICNDTYVYTDKKMREKFFKTIIERYEECDIIITDRFHGFIFSILCRKPCMIIDNITGKIKHFYDDIKEDISGCIYIDSEKYSKNVLDTFLNSKERLIILDSFESKKSIYLSQIKEDLIGWREKHES